MVPARLFLLVLCCTALLACTSTPRTATAQNDESAADSTTFEEDPGAEEPEGVNETAPPAGETSTPASVTTPPATTDPVAGYADELVARHNHWRALVGVPPLSWSPELATYAQEWANHLQARDCAMEHRSGDSPYGENLFWSSNGWAPGGIVDSWAEEAKDYTYATNTCAEGKTCGHYTQVVWRNTARVGCARALCGSAEVWVCNYYPPGNYSGEIPY